MFSKKFVGALVCALALGAGALFVKTVGASSYEWISEFNTPQGCCTGQTPINISWKTSTNDNYYEYRTLYHGTSTSMTDLPTQWYEYFVPQGQDVIYPCRKEGYINGTSPTEGCTVTPFNPDAQNLVYWIRATTNYSGCGTWTSEPQEFCGDAVSAAFPFYHSP